MEKKTVDFDELPSERLPNEFIEKMKTQLIESSKITNSEKEQEQIIDEICKLDLLNSVDFKKFLETMKKINIEKQESRKKNISVPIISNLAIDSGGKKWFMVCPNSSIVSFYDSQKTPNKQSKRHRLLRQ